MDLLKEGVILIQSRGKKFRFFFNEEARHIFNMALPQFGGRISLDKFIHTHGQKWAKILKGKSTELETETKIDPSKSFQDFVFIDYFFSHRRKYEVFGTMLKSKRGRQESMECCYLFVLKRPNSAMALFQKMCRDKRLTPREKNIFALLLLGFSNKEISTQLNLSTNTVKTYIKNLALKLGARSRVDIIMNLVKSIIPGISLEEVGAFSKNRSKS